MTKKILLAFAIFALFVIPNISSLGITPGRTTVDFSPALEKEINFNVVNSENKNMDVAFVIQGELEEIITLNNKLAHFYSNESSKSFSYKINLPSELPPGLHKIEIVAIELPENFEDEEIIVKSTIGVVTQLYIYVPYPGKYLDANLDIVSEKENSILFYVPVISRGTEEIKDVRGTIEIYQDNKKISEIETTNLQLLPGERKELSGILESGLLPGKYNATAKINYDGKKLEVRKEFEFGEDFIKILGVSADDFQLGEVARIKIIVQNLQQNKIEKSYANIRVYDQELVNIADLKSEDYDIPGLSNKEFIIYWDTEDVGEGQYSSELKVNYDEKFSTKNMKIDVSKDSMLFSGVGFAISNSNKDFSIKNILIIIIGILVLANVLWFLWWIQKRKK